MHNELSIVTLVANASLLVQVVMGLLLAVSLASWTAIFRKWFQIREARIATDSFEGDFWKDRDLGALFQQVRDGKRESGSLAPIHPTRPTKLTRPGTPPPARTGL